jgi:hypothetical protein
MPDVIWKLVVDRLASEDEFDRTAALARAVGSIETALTVAGDPNPKAPVFHRLRRYLGAPIPVDVADALNARNEAIHNLRAPTREECGHHLEALEKVWTKLKRVFVNKITAAEIADKIVAATSSEVFIYGSVAREGTEQNDIDFLILDHGELSYLLERPYKPGPQADIEIIFEATGIATDQNRAAATLGWLQFIILDGRRFGSNIEYMQRLVRIQNDPFFFLNLAPDVLRYDIRKRRWTKEGIPSVFQRHATLRLHLEAEGLITPHRRGRRRRAG